MDMEKGEISYEQFSTIKVRRSKALKKLEQTLIKFQGEFKKVYISQVKDFLQTLEKKKIDKK